MKCNIQFGTKYALAYEHYFGMKIRDQDKVWVPHVKCATCRSRLEDWFRGGRKVMPFAIPRIWREPRNHVNDCYFCMVDITKFRKTSHRNDIDYPNIPSSMAPVFHSKDLPVPKPLEQQASRSESPMSTTESDDKFQGEVQSHEPHFTNQEKVDDLKRDLGLTKGNAELLISRLQECNLVDKDCRSTAARKRHEKYARHFDMKESLCYSLAS